MDTLSPIELTAEMVAASVPNNLVLTSELARSYSSGPYSRGEARS